MSSAQPAPAAPTPAAASIAPGSGLLARLDGDRELLMELIDLFLKTCPPLVESMRQALSAGDGVVVARAAHTLAGSASNFDAAEVTARAHQLEALARSGDLAASSDLFATLEAGVSQLLSQLVTLRRLA